MGTLIHRSITWVNTRPVKDPGYVKDVLNQPITTMTIGAGVVQHIY